MWPPYVSWPTFRTCDLRPLGTTNCWNGCPKIFSRRYSTPSSIKKFPRPRSANFQHPRRVSSSLCSLISSALLIRLELVMSSFSPPLSFWWSETEPGLTLGSSVQSPPLLIATSPSSSSSSSSSILQSVFQYSWYLQSSSICIMTIIKHLTLL